MVMNFIFVGVLLYLGFKGPHTGLALASSAAAYVNAGLLYRMLRRQGAYRPEPGWSRVLFAVAAACAAMVLALLWQYGDLAGWVQASAVLRASHLCLLIGLGVVVYGLVLVGAGLRPRHLAKGAS
jgi:putative peptidoglycan lipid II flippase